MELGLVQKKRGKPKKRALVNSNSFCRLTRRSVVDKDDAIRLISDTCMENFSFIYVNDDFKVEDDLLSVHSINEDDDNVSLISVVKLKPNSVADYAGYSFSKKSEPEENDTVVPSNCLLLPSVSF